MECNFGENDYIDAGEAEYDNNVFECQYVKWTII